VEAGREAAKRAARPLKPIFAVARPRGGACKGQAG
jgi:hypothetical protein